jgi:YidC/Oxa1 family membrane protein insertase
MSKKIFFIAMILMVVFSLAACGSGSSETAAIAVNNPFGENGEKLVFDHDEANNIIFKGDNGLSYWTLSDAGVGELVTYDGALPTNVQTDSNGVRTYTFTVEDIEVNFQIYIKPETIVGNANDVVMVAFRYGVDNVLYQIGERFDSKGIEAYAVERDGDIIKLHETLDEEAFAALFDDHDYNPLGDDGFRNKYAYDVTFTYGGVTKDIEVYVAGGERPISTEDATFFDWILVIPVAFVMNFFSSLLGNNFAVGILFTTIVVRTIAWPIYAKSNDMSIKMNVAQPDMARVQQKYATRKDPQSQ